MVKTVKDVCEIIWEIEKKENLLQKEIADVKFWQLVRFSIFNEITKGIGLYGQAHSKENNKLNKLKSMPMLIYNSITKNPFLNKNKIEVLIFDHPRKKKINNEYVDIYTKYLLDELEDKQFTYEVLESSYLDKHLTNRKEKNRNYFDAYYLFTLKKRIIGKIEFSDNEIDYINYISCLFNNKFDLNIDFKSIIKKSIKRFKLQYHFYNSLLKKRKPKKIYVVVSYVNQALISAAKVNNIEIIEIQHGTISPYHLGYSYPYNNSELDYFPNKIYTFGEFWKKNIKFPIPRQRLYNYGFPYLNEQIKRFKSAEKNKNQIIFLSQGTIGEKLSELAFNLAQELRDYKILYKLHPGEFNRWEQEYPALLRAKELKNFIIIDNNEVELYSLLSQSEIQIGVYSTAIFEGLVLMCRTILINLPGIEYMEPLIKDKSVLLATNVIEIKESIKKGNTRKISPESFFNGYSSEVNRGDFYG